MKGRPGLPAWLALATAATLDAATTRLGLYSGLEEQGPLASRLLPLLGGAYWLAAFLILYTTLYALGALLERSISRDQARGKHLDYKPGTLLEAATLASLLTYLVVAWANYLLAVGG